MEDEDDISLASSTTNTKILPPKDTPLERRALLSLEKQLELEQPESKHDFRVSDPTLGKIQLLFSRLEIPFI